MDGRMLTYISHIRRPRKPRSLISTSLRNFCLCTAAIFLLSAPLFYLLTRYFYAEDLMEVIHAARSGHTIPPLDLERDIIAGTMLQFLLTFAILSLAMFITIRFITRRLWHPFDDTLTKTEAFSLSEARLPSFLPTDIIEFNRLNDSLKQLMIRSRETYRIQKEFTENASHELQTPLAVSRGRLDLLMQEDLSCRQLEIVAELYRINSRMEHLNRNLLLLAKIDNSQFSDPDEINLSDFIATLLPSYTLLQGDSEVSFDCDAGYEPRIKANATLLESMLNNLIVNALRHTPASASVRIRLFPGCPDVPVLEVSNPSDGTALDPDLIFRRFQTTGYASGRALLRNSAPANGHGLGLAIVRAICDYHHWQIRYTHADDRHRFSVFFPTTQ